MFEEVNPRLPLMLVILVGLFASIVIGELGVESLDITKWVAAGGFLVVLVVLAHRYSLQAREELRK
ncbi:hypothetical protein [Candidatus Halobonum tyrrellensis]|uniref:hypothetical protein n=1 Tax=Candidatus Halobonum tyrrellensis TaxID=1431545 RepID=UPI001267C98B|nr:hypothetical protein [Candidatus Halobonum tyrrellensis]